jgi:HAD superfamily hydrolase (TIGR01490 family)
MQNNHFCQPAKINEKQNIIVAAFDFDGTMTTKDSLPVFLTYTSGFFKTWAKLFLHVPLFLLCLTKQVSRQHVKESLLESFFKGVSIDYIQSEGEKFAMGPLKSIVKPISLKKLKWHQSEGHVCILVSANLDVYLNAFASEHGFDHCLCSKVGFDSQKKITGQLIGLNCIGEEKVRRLTELLGSKENYTLYAYGDSNGDKEMLALADYPFYRLF